MPTAHPSDRRYTSAFVLIGVLLASVLAFAVVAYLHFDDHIPAYQLLDDTTDFSGVKWYTGLLSNLVILLWCASAAVCGFAGLSLRRLATPEQQNLSRLLLLLAAANVWIMFDDLLLVHEQVARLVFGKEWQHVGEGLIFAAYASVVALVLWKYRATIEQTQYLILLAALFSFGASITIDVVFQLELNGNNLFRETVLAASWGPGVIDIGEEILKLNGAMLWFLYFSMTAMQGVRAAFGAARGIAR